MEMEKNFRLAKDVPDEELIEHLKELDNFNLRSAGWVTEPLDNIEMDFVSGLHIKFM
jgi:hypothetical protein